MDVEDHFGITIQDTTAERIRTVGDLVSLIHDRLSVAQRSYCPTLPSFLKLRASVRATAGDDSFRIRPRDKIAEILTPFQRRELWKHLPNLLGIFPRQLRRPPALRNILAASAVALLFTFPLTLAVAAIAIFNLHAFTVCFRVTPPQDWATFADVAIKIVGATMATKYLHLRSIEDIFVELRPIIVETLEVDKDEVVLSARFIEDLGVGL